MLRALVVLAGLASLALVSSEDVKLVDITVPSSYKPQGEDSYGKWSLPRLLSPEGHSIVDNYRNTMNNATSCSLHCHRLASGAPAPCGGHPEGGYGHHPPHFTVWWVVGRVSWGDGVVGGRAIPTHA